MNYYGWPCDCPQCCGDEPEEYDDFEEWALDESERQHEANLWREPDTFEDLENVALRCGA